MSSITAQDLLIRPPTMDDLETVFELMKACQQEDMGQVDMTLEDLRTDWTDVDFDIQRDAWLLFTPENKLVGFGGIWNQQHSHLYNENNVHPDYRGQGIGSRILQMCETRAREHIALAPADVRVVLNSWTISTNEAAKRILERENFTIARHFFRMMIEMNEAPPEPCWPENIKVRTFVKGQDNKRIFEADEEAFSDHWGHVAGVQADWEHHTIERASFDPSLWFLAMDGEEIAGFAMCRNEMPQHGWVGTLGVRRNWRKQGLGLALLQQAFGEFYRRGQPKVGLGVDASSLTGAVRLYEKAGMKAVLQFDRYWKELRPGRELAVETLAE